MNFWLGKQLGIPGLEGDFRHQRLPQHFEVIRDLVTESIQCERIDASLDNVTTKAIYKSYTEILPPPKVEERYPLRDWELIWKRINNGVLSPAAKNVFFLLMHDRVGTKDRGNRLMPRRFRSPMCPRCSQSSETQTHRYAGCPWVGDAWEKVREIIDELEPGLGGISDKNLLHLVFSERDREEAVIWLLGCYLQYVEEEVVRQGRVVEASGLVGYLQYQKMRSQYIAMPFLGYIPGVDRLGIG